MAPTSKIRVRPIAPSLDEFAVRLGRMNRQQRLKAYHDGHFNHAERTFWTAHYPEEVPIVNDEIEWIALGLADLD